jgi:hypothetical protein
MGGFTDWEGDDQKRNECAYLLMIEAISLEGGSVLGAVITTGEGCEDEGAEEFVDVDESSLDIDVLSNSPGMWNVVVVGT